MRCKCSEKSIDSCPKINNKAYDVNHRLISVLRLLGIGLKGFNQFCGLMDISRGIANKTYYACLESFKNAANAVFESVLKKAVCEEKDLNVQHDNIKNHLKVSGDGAWKKRGFSSLFGISTLIGNFSHKVLDAAIKSSFCQACKNQEKLKETDIDEFNLWYENHEKNFTANHSRSAGKMEIDAITEMFARSVEKYGVKYVRYVGDGDSKTYKGILSVNPYGNENIVEKKEYVGHVKKRMGSRLRNVKKDNKGIRKR